MRGFLATGVSEFFIIICVILIRTGRLMGPIRANMIYKWSIHNYSIFLQYWTKLLYLTMEARTISYNTIRNRNIRTNKKRNIFCIIV